MTRPDINPEDFYPEPDQLETVIKPLPTSPIETTPSSNENLPAGVSTPGPPAVGSLGFRPRPPIIEVGQGGTLLDGPVTVDDARRELLNIGRYDAFVGIVRSIYYEGSPTKHPTLGMRQGISVERIDVRWDPDTNLPLGSVTPSPETGSNNVVVCKPWPGRHDQELHNVAVGDIVTVLRGSDGLHWFMSDDLPFIGKVVVWDDDDITEEFSGGADSRAGLDGLKVRQQAITGDPTSALSSLADLETIADDWDATVTYAVDDTATDTGDSKVYRSLQANNINHDPSSSAAWWEEDNIVIHRYVNVLKPENASHGYRVGDDILVVRRGLYLFALPSTQVFLAQTFTGAGSGPAGEADFADEHYWVIESSGLVTPNTHSWTFDASPLADRDSADPTGSGGVRGRHVDAANLFERPAGSHLLSDNVLVEVTMWQDAQGDPYYTFDHATPHIELDGKVKVSDNDTTPEFLDEKVTADETWLTTTEINDGGDEDWKLSHIGPLQSTSGYFIEITGLTGKVMSDASTCKDSVCGIRIDIRGHIFAYENQGSSNWVNWPDGAPDYS